MNLSTPSEAVVPTLDGPVLVALARLSSPVTGRQLHRLSGVGSEAGVRNALSRLVRQGIVRVSIAGGAYLYAANREHVAWPVAQGLADLRSVFLSRLRAAFDDWDPRPRSGAVYGSFARGDGDIDSDIDVLIVRLRHTDIDDERWLDQVSRLRAAVQDWTGNSCQILDLGGDDLDRFLAARDPLIAAWRAEAIPIAGTDIRRVLAGTRREPHA